ncbi:MAG: serine/threonine-protein kinase [Anaerolineae bacterium]|nr:serine/threonine-protein kinase [Anaerolineae bacterium]
MDQTLTGKEINGYQIGPLLGIGGMGEVYQAIPPDGSTPIAIKLLRKDYMADAKLQQRFIRETRILRALSHDNIVKIYDHGLIDGQQLFYTMELITGMPLSTMMKRQEFSPLLYWEILRQVSAALAFAHMNKVIHRDIKPSNIFIQPKGNGLHVVLADFGLGKQEGVDQTMTEMGTSLGTPHYMSPEAILGEKPNAVSDNYAIAIMTYEALLGRPPFDFEFAHQIAMAHVTHPIPPPIDLRDDFPTCLEDVLMKGLEKKPEERYQSVKQFSDDYLACLKALSNADRKKVYHVASN